MLSSPSLMILRCQDAFVGKLPNRRLLQISLSVKEFFVLENIGKSVCEKTGWKKKTLAWNNEEPSR